MKLIWMTAPALVAVAVTGCSDDKSSSSAATSTVASAASSVAAPDPSIIAEPGGGVRITLGETKKVLIPADAVMDIKVPAEWGPASSSLRCTVTDGTGRNEDLRSSDVKKQESIGGKDWTTIWTFSSPPATEVTVGCKDPDAKIPATDVDYIRVLPRGLNPH
ncbi:hypothetical protein ACFQZZ_18845 [Nocardia sp. GCM10030253]|uniref:hypothetical protein n=1 Tax=Nocardia sp. GCM10030253 TaxID=3273404 RepID=UPI003638E0B0